MSEMLERVALAIEAARGTVPPGYNSDLHIARAAIEAMREPTEEMIEAVAREGYVDHALPGWETMIDVALGVSN